LSENAEKLIENMLFAMRSAHGFFADILLAANNMKSNDADIVDKRLAMHAAHNVTLIAKRAIFCFRVIFLTEADEYTHSYGEIKIFLKSVFDKIKSIYFSVNDIKIIIDSGMRGGKFWYDARKIETIIYLLTRSAVDNHREKLVRKIMIFLTDNAQNFEILIKYKSGRENFTRLKTAKKTLRGVKTGTLAIDKNSDFDRLGVLAAVNLLIQNVDFSVEIDKNGLVSMKIIFSKNPKRGDYVSENVEPIMAASENLAQIFLTAGANFGGAL
jgi:hypothetical protein